ncbi:hypothetical protein [Actinomadura spongiicola]|uniref:hypothetical protein n=1 Tax=Actinomadura spongiicola TaxID=2303421 RepID=UPI0011C0DD0A|nr:hypothetical protein [Actinomadura spongiicola]
MSDWAKAYVTIDGHDVFPAQVATWTSWNGAACPRFTRQVVERVVEAVTKTKQRAPYEDAEELFWDGDVIICRVPGTEGQEGYEPERIEPDHDGMYAIGWKAWTWSEVWCHGDTHSGEPDDLATPVAILTWVELDQSRPDAQPALTDAAFCAPCLERARAAHPKATVTSLPPL